MVRMVTSVHPAPSPVASRRSVGPVLAAFLIGFAAVTLPSVAEAGSPAQQVAARRDLYVKFHDDLTVRLRDGSLEDLGSGALVGARAALDRLTADGRARWQRVHTVDEERLTAIRSTAEARLHRVTPDLNTEFYLRCADSAASERAAATLRAVAVVEAVRAVATPVAPPATPKYVSNQGYLNPAPSGLDAKYAWSQFGNRGEGIRFADLEYTFNASHAEFPAITVVGGTPQDPGFGDSHGTAVLGIVASQDNGWGVTGMCGNASFHFAGTFTDGIWNVAGAITNCLATFEAGDVIIIEQQVAGPLYDGSSQAGLVPVEWELANYNAIVNAVGNGIIVVEAAGNGSQDLDAAIYSEGNGGHWPFLAANDSGAIIVGAGAAPAGSTTDRSRLWFSNWGSRVNVQGWGEKVTTTGYGDLYSAEGVNKYFTAGFNGTSSATPTVAGVCTLLQSVAKATSGTPIEPLALRASLMATGSPQTSGSAPLSQHIGPRPNLHAAVVELGLTCPVDLSHDGVVDGADLAMMMGAWGACSNCVSDFDGSGVVDGADLAELLAAWGACAP
jgi:serine protease